MNENTKIWDATKDPPVERVKKLRHGPKLHAIDPQWRIQAATEQFGAVGHGWGYTAEFSACSFGDYVLAVADVTVWHGDRANCFGPVRATEIMGRDPSTRTEQLTKQINDALHSAAETARKYGMDPDAAAAKAIVQLVAPRPDDDAWKKALTDALGKALSHLGIGASVHLGRYDDDKYVSAVRQTEQDAEAEAARNLSVESLKARFFQATGGDDASNDQLALWLTDGEFGFDDLCSDETTIALGNRLFSERMKEVPVARMLEAAREGLKK